MADPRPAALGLARRAYGSRSFTERVFFEPKAVSVIRADTDRCRARALAAARRALLESFSASVVFRLALTPRDAAFNGKLLPAAVSRPFAIAKHAFVHRALTSTALSSV
jgi:hypothetical protein